MEQVELNSVEFQSACYSGLLIHAASEAEGLRGRVWNPRLNSLYIHQVGQIAERVVAKALDLYWSGAAWTFKEPDLSHRIEVRATRRWGQGVKVRPRDYDDKKVVGVLVEEDKLMGPYTILGWIVAKDGKQEAWGKRPYGGPLYYEVPIKALRPIAELRDIVRREIAQGGIE